ncbi:unnamed protein product [Paramecium sonneborni]|uniref:Uncharacterized protein n=1 Tax=Paramecium sonneborni TaxID=65129 RepID=A0A8S1RID7_9CILI|nr:unnamed protein product [Paramecium sonneborni]
MMMIVEFSPLTLDTFRTLWFYIILFGGAFLFIANSLRQFHRCQRVQKYLQ